MESDSWVRVMAALQNLLAHGERVCEREFHCMKSKKLEAKWIKYKADNYV